MSKGIRGILPLRPPDDEWCPTLDVNPSTWLSTEPRARDRVSDLSNDVMHTFRSAMRETAWTMDDRIEVLKTGSDWDAMVRDLQTAVAEHVTAAFIALEQGRASIRQETATLLRDEQAAALPPLLGQRFEPIDLSEI